MSLPFAGFDFGSYPEDGFFDKVASQVSDDHRSLRERNRRKRAVWAQAPAMQMAASLVQGPFGLEPEGEAEYADMLVRMTESLFREPLVQRYENHLNQGNVLARNNTEWWHALGHQYLAAIGWCNALSRAEAMALKPDKMPIVLDERLWLTTHAPDGTERPSAFADVGPRELALEWAGRTLESKTYLWHQNTLDAACAAPLVPHVVQPNAMPFESIFFSFESAAWSGIGDDYDVINVDGRPIPVRTETWWVMVTVLADAGMMLTFDRQYWPTASPSFVPQTHHIMEPIPWGAKWPESFQNRPFREQIGAVLRMLAFMQAPFVDTTLLERRLPRPMRREYDRQGKEAPIKEVSVITLRRALYEPVWNGNDHEVSHDRFSHSWWVNGHYRWQWYPSEKNHKLIAIAPYMKQVGKPLLPQIRDVSR